ncbi:MAG: DUF4476 domain-containing protein [Bacteroidota bacterium]
MKSLFFTILMFWLSFVSLSQSNLTIFNNGDYTFHIMLNGIKQNQFPQKNVTISNVSTGGHALKVVFANGASADIDKKLYLDEPSDIRMSIEFKKGKGKLKIISYEPTKGVQANALAFRPNDNAVYGDAVVTNNSQQNVQNQGTVQGTINSNSNSNATTTSNSTSNSTTTVTTTSTNSTNQPPSNGSVNVNIGSTGNTSNSTNGNVNIGATGNSSNTTNGNLNLNVGANGMSMNVVDPVTGQAINMNVNMNVTGGENTNVQSNSSTTVTTTSTTVTTTGQSNQTGKPTNETTTNLNSNSTNSNTTVNTTNTNSSNNQVNSIKGSAKINCSKVLANFDSYLKQIKELNFESDQVEEIQKDLEFTCLTSSQAYKIVEILTFESNRLDIAKYLSDRMTNRDKAGDLLPLFTFDSNKVEYKDYIR